MAGLRILVVDDEADFVAVMRTRLEASGYEVFSAIDGVSGLQMAQTHTPDCILLDIGMPQMDGFTFVTQIKQMQKLQKIPIIIVSARGQGMQDLFMQEGVQDYLVKPFDTQKLLDIIRMRIMP